MPTKSVLSAKSTKIVDQVIALLSIRENTQFYSQGTFVSRSINNHCETECCLAGWMVYASSKSQYARLASKRDDVGIHEAATELMKLADGSEVNTNNLFTGSGGNWPSGLGAKWNRTRSSSIVAGEDDSTRFALAKVAIERLKLFKKQGW